MSGERTISFCPRIIDQPAAESCSECHRPGRLPALLWEWSDCQHDVRWFHGGRQGHLLGKIQISILWVCKLEYFHPKMEILSCTAFTGNWFGSLIFSNTCSTVNYTLYLFKIWRCWKLNNMPDYQSCFNVRNTKWVLISKSFTVMKHKIDTAH